MKQFLWCPKLRRKWKKIFLFLVGLFIVHFCVSILNASYEYLDLGLGEVHDPFESRQRHECTVDTPYRPVTRNNFRQYDKWSIDTDVCYIEDELMSVDISVSDVYDRISVGYPNWILTVIGWTDTIKVERWTVKPITVIVLPHSHQDPGWLETMEHYYRTRTKHTLDYMVEQLTSNPSYRFIWAEVIMLQKWWAQASNDMQEKVKKLLENGQLELVTGGWVMTDESVTHYGAMLDQLIEGQMWLKNNLNVTVENSWAIDPFGHSSTWTYILKESKIKHMIIQRTHYALKRYLASTKQLEFFWRQPWDKKGTTDIFCHMMPFLLYSIPHSCGPDRHVCCKFDFHSKHCFYGNEKIDLLKVDDMNIKELSSQLWEQLQKKSELFDTDVILMPHGDDFRYDSWEEWNQQFGNLQKLMNYINDQSGWKIEMKFGTLKDYFEAFRRSKKVSNSFFPSLSGDFFQYSDRDDQYWSGYYTTRPFFKYLVRQLQQLLRSTEILFSFTVGQLNWNANMTLLHEKLTECRRTLALCQHHDAITGTSKEEVMESFTTKVQSTLEDTTQILQSSLQMIISQKYNKHVDVNSVENFFISKTVPVRMVLNTRKSNRILIWNDLAQPRNDIVEIIIDMPAVKVTDKDLKPIPFQISPLWINERTVADNQYLLRFEVKIEAFSITTFTIQVSASMSVEHISKLYISGGQDKLNVSKNNLFPISTMISDVITLSNSYIKAIFKKCNGMLYSIQIDGYNKIQSDIHYYTYSTGRNVHPFRDKSGAYIFLPDGNAKELTERPHVYITIGNVFSEVRSIYRNIVHVSKLYNVSGTLGSGIQVENFVNINTDDWNNYELVMRVETDINGNDQQFCTDSNGLQMYPRKTRPKMKIQGNVYPMTSAAIVQNDKSRMSLLSEQSHGVASLVTGWMEVFLDRRLVQDDWRGLNQGVEDNTLSKSSFFILYENKHHSESLKSKLKKKICLPTMRSTILSNLLNSPLKVFEAVLPSGTTLPQRQNYDFSPAFPCDVHVVNLKLLSEKEALITLQRSGIDCNYPTNVTECLSKIFPLWSDLSFQLKSVIETSLTGIKDVWTIPLHKHIDVDPMTLKTYKLIFV
ncbi:hypothetical protein ACF0H5_002872 [Mactra antiquata]